MKLLWQIFKTMEKSEFCVLIKHCFLMGKNTVQTKQWLDKCYSDSAQLETMVKRWYADRVVHTQIMLNAQVTLIWHLSQKTPKKLHKLILANRKLKLREIAEELKISEGSVFTILHEPLSMRKLFIVGATFAHSRSKMTRWGLRVLFAIASMQQKGVFA